MTNTQNSVITTQICYSKMRTLRQLTCTGSSEFNPNVLGQVGSQLAAAGDPSPKNKHNLEIIFSAIFIMLIGTTLSMYKAGS